MSAGTIAIGATNFYGPRYYKRIWSGTDSKYSTVAGTKRFKDNPYTMTLLDLKCKGSDTVPSRQLSGNYTVPHVWTANNEVSLQSSLVEAVKGHQFNLMVTTAESRESFKMMYGSIASLGNAMRHLRRGDISSAARMLGIQGKHQTKLDKDDLAGRWLELQYGWLPMLSDIHEGQKAFASLNDKSRRFTVYARSSSRTFTWGGSSSPSNWQNSGRGRTQRRILYRMDESISSARSLGLLDPLSLAWELVPYSFVVDWFVPIGAYLENLSCVPKLRGTFVTTTFSSGTVYVRPLQNLIYYGGAKIDGKSVRLDRTVSTQLSTARPSFKPIERIFSPGHFWNALALSARHF